MKSLKALIKNLPVIGNLALSIYRLFKPKKIFSSAYWINKYIPNDRLSVVQIGSNDGISLDPLHQLVKKNKLWNVIFVEPVTYIFERLKKNYGNEPRFKFENSAINEDGSKQFFYSVNKDAYDNIPNLSHNYKQISSFDKDHILKLSGGVVDKYITEIEVNCITLNQLFKKTGIESLDLFFIDAEGYDWKILSQLNLSQYKPVVIVFEYVNLNESERFQAINFLKYEILIF